MPRRSFNFATYSAVLGKTCSAMLLEPQTPDEPALNFGPEPVDPNEPQVAVWPFPVIQNGVRPPK